MTDTDELIPDPSSPSRHVTKKVSVIFSISLFAGYIVFGIGSSFAAPALLDIAAAVGSTFHAVSFGQVSRSIGYGSGGVIIGWSYRHINRQIGCTMCLILSGLMLLSVPFIKNVTLYIAIEGIYGFFTGGIDCASNAWIMELWPEYSSPFMQALHFFFAIGMVVSPLIDEPFLTPINNTNGSDPQVGEFFAAYDILSNEKPDGDNHVTMVLIPGASNLLIPYLIGAAGFMTVAFCQIILRCYIKYEVPAGDQLKKRTISAGSSASQAAAARSQKYKLIVTILAMMLFISYASTEMNSFTFIAEYAVYCDLKLSKSTGAYMSSVMAASFAVSRGLSALIAAKVLPKYMLYGSVAMITIGNLLLIFLGNTSVTGLWVAIVILGSGHSSIIGNLYSFLEERIEMSTLICGCCMFSCCVGSIVSPIVVGSFLKDHPSVFGFINVAGLTVVLLILTSFKLVDRIFAKQVQQEGTTSSEDVPSYHIVS